MRMKNTLYVFKNELYYSYYAPVTIVLNFVR